MRVELAPLVLPHEDAQELLALRSALVWSSGFVVAAV